MNKTFDKPLLLFLQFTIGVVVFSPILLIIVIIISYFELPLLSPYIHFWEGFKIQGFGMSVFLLHSGILGLLLIQFFLKLGSYFSIKFSNYKEKEKI